MINHASYVARTIGLALLMLVAPPPQGAARAQDSSGGAWTQKVVGQLSVNQLAYKDWQETGLNTLAATTVLDASAKNQTGEWQQEYEANFVFGLIKQDTFDVRKAEDEIRLESALQYTGDGFFKTFNPTVAATVRTQFASGFNYKKDPLDREREPPVKVSDFLTPAILTQSIGLTYEPSAWIAQRISIDAKQTMMHLRHLRPIRNMALDQPVRYELGVGANVDVDREVFENVHLESELGLFTAFNRELQQPDLQWENNVAMEINSWLGVNFQLVTRYEKDVARTLQLKEAFSLAISVAVI